jgi:hypothetical protein
MENAAKLPLFRLTAVERTLGSLIGDALANEFKKIGIGLREAGVCQSIGADVALPPRTRARQKKVPNCGEGVRTVRCLVAHQRTYWAGSSRALCGSSRIATASARAS